jgi:hypothetical protein
MVRDLDTGLGFEMISDLEADFYLNDVRFATVLGGNVLFWESSTSILSGFKKKDFESLKDFMAPVIAKMLNNYFS